MKTLCIRLIQFYRKYLSPLKPHPTCRFTPTCSAYAIEAFEKRGFFVGLFLSVWRILRCNPFCVPGYDPVPEKGEWPWTVRKKLREAADAARLSPVAKDEEDSDENESGE